MNRPRVFRERFIQHLCCFFKLVVLLADRVLLFAWNLAADCPVQPVFAVPVRPLHGCPFELAGGFSRAEVFDDFRLEQSDEGFG